MQLRFLDSNRVGVIAARCAVVAALAVPSVASAVSINSATCVPEADNALRFECTVETNVAASFGKVNYCDATVSGTSCTKSRETPVDFTGVFTAAGCAVGATCYRYHLKTWNMITAHDYEYNAFASGTPSATSATYTETADPLPAGLDDISLSVSGTSDANYMAFNYGCSTSTGNFGDYAMVADTDGNIVWYEDPRVVTGNTSAYITSIKALEHSVIVIVDDEWLIEYHWDGTIMGNLDRTSLDFRDAAMYDRYIHHDVHRTSGGDTYVITAKSHVFSDTSNNCDSNSGTTTLNWIMDGVFKFNSSWAKVDGCDSYPGRYVTTNRGWR